MLMMMLLSKAGEGFHPDIWASRRRRERRRRRRRRGYGKDKRRHRRRKEWRWQFAESALPTNTGAIPPSTSILSFHNFSISISTQSFHNLAAVSSSY